MFIFNFNVVLFCHPAPELSPVSLTKLGLCRGTEEKQAFLQFLKKVAVENGFLRALADIRKIRLVPPSVRTCWWHREGQIYDLQNII